MLEPIHSMNVPVRPFVLNPKTKRGLQYWQTLIRDWGYLQMLESKGQNLANDAESPLSHSLSMDGWRVLVAGTHTHMTYIASSQI